MVRPQPTFPKATWGHILGKPKNPSEWLFLKTLRKSNVIHLTKIDVADAQLRAAVCMYFEGGHPVPVYTLANAAREIVDSIGKKMGITTSAQSVADLLGIPAQDVLRLVTTPANFFKHADRDAYTKLAFDEAALIAVLSMLCQRFEDVANGLPVEAIVFRVWLNALTAKVTQVPLSHQQHIRNCIKLFPGIRRAADLAEQKMIGLKHLKKTLADPLQIEMFNRFDREVVLPPKILKR
jgi:hypothetical protein